MNKAIPVILFSAFLLLSTATQAQFFVQGKLFEYGKKSPIVSANVSITHSGIGTASDESGNFIVKIDPEFYHEKLRISSLGYASRELSIDSLSRLTDQQHVIYLKPQPIELTEVAVRDSRISPEDLLKETFAAIPKNYSQVPFNMEFYSKMELKDSARIYYTQETILTSYRKGYIPDANTWSAITQQRITGESMLAPHVDKKTTQKYFPYNPTFNISFVDQLGNFKESAIYSVFNPKRFHDMTFTYAGVSVFDKDTVMAVDYQQKKTNSMGTIYIALNTMAIVRHTLKGTWDFDIIYKKIDGLYYPYFLKSTYHYDLFVQSGIKNLHILQTVLLRSVTTKNLTVIEQNTPRPYWAEEVQYKKEYWDTHFPKR